MLGDKHLELDMNMRSLICNKHFITQTQKKRCIVHMQKYIIYKGEVRLPRLHERNM